MINLASYVYIETLDRKTFVSIYLFTLFPYTVL